VLNFAIVLTYGKLGSRSWYADFEDGDASLSVLLLAADLCDSSPFREGSASVAVGLVVMAIGARLELHSTWLGVLLKLALMGA
jgi:hypothetical protein